MCTSCHQTFTTFVSTGSPSSFADRPHEVTLQRYYRRLFGNITIVKKIVQKMGQNKKIDLPVVYNLCFYGVWRGFRAISVGFSFSVVFSIRSPYMEKLYREAKTH